MPRSPTLNLAIYPSTAWCVSSASITNPSAATQLSFIPLDRNVRPPPMVQFSFLTLLAHSYRLSSSNSTAVSPFFSSSQEIRAQIRIVTTNIRIRPKRNRGVKAAEILFVTKLKRINDRVVRKSKAAALAISRRGAASIVEGTVMLARGRVGDDYTTGLFTDGARPRHEHLLRETTLRARSATPSVVAAIARAAPRRARPVITRLQVALSTKSDPSPPPRAAQARSACGESTDVVVVNGEPVYQLYRYFSPPNALLPEGSLQRHEHVEPHLFVVLDTVLVHDLRFCHKARNQKYQH
ncbi:hypothetical protein ALC57_08568 [Trachymyrmex cornetzi]|uniref:Uncharacterized protein n=1 Tax=Trachymyrmex cornetzi TaxID=471704 RepID=A0A151J6V3_9HYME|nr:hypothetical protein ALC57_08568 [Trachymyrmex cornetzi]